VYRSSALRARAAELANKRAEHGKFDAEYPRCESRVSPSMWTRTNMYLPGPRSLLVFGSGVNKLKRAAKCHKRADVSFELSAAGDALHLDWIDRSTGSPSKRLDKKDVHHEDIVYLLLLLHIESSFIQFTCSPVTLMSNFRTKISRLFRRLGFPFFAILAVVVSFTWLLRAHLLILTLASCGYCECLCCQ